MPQLPEQYSIYRSKRSIASLSVMEGGRGDGKERSPDLYFIGS
jgi:hypothetical protein